MITKRTMPLVFACFVAWSYIPAAVAQSNGNQYRAVHWTIYDGLSQGENYYMLKDVHGFLWTGTKNGLNRFDGNLVKNYYHDPHNVHTILSSVILGLAEDSLHNIWIGTDRGLSRLDIKADTFSNFPLAKNGDPNHDAIPFWATPDKLYAQEGASIVVYDIRTLTKKKVVPLSPNDGSSFGTSPQYSVFDHKSNCIWMLRSVEKGSGGGLMKISLKDGKKRYLSWPCYRHIPGHDHNSEAMRFDSKKNAIWINSPDGLVEFTLADEQFHQVGAMKDIIKSKDYDRFVGIDIDRLGRIWFATVLKGICIYDPLTHALSVPFPKDTVLQKEVSNANSIIYCDREGMIWLGTWLRNGIYQLMPYSPAVKLFTPEPKQPLGFGSNMVFLFHNVGSGKLWVVTDGSLYQFDKQKAMLGALDRKEFPGYKAGDAIVPLLVDTNLRKAWINNAGAYFEMNLDTRKSVPVTFEDSTGKPIGRVEQQTFLIFKNGWIITGVYNNRKYIFTGKKSSPVAKASGQVPINAGLNFGCVTDGEYLLFLKRDEAEGNLTYNYNNGRWLRVPHKIDSLQWTSIFFNAKDRSYWVAGENKLWHFNKDFNLIRSFGSADGLPSLVIVGLTADNNGNIWFHTDRSIHQLNIITGEISTLTEKDGFEKQNFALFGMNYKDDNGDIYFGGGIFGSGFNIITPDHYTNPPSSIYLQSLDVNQMPFRLPTGINNLKELSLNYSENKITVETGIIDFYSKGSSHMRYKLEQKGGKKNWQYGPANYTIRFEDLQPGKYKLYMQASNAALQFDGPEKILLINISPPWWQTWWAWTGYITLFVTSVYAFIAYRSRKLVKEKHVLEEKVAVRTKQLSDANNELNEKQEEIISQRDQLSETLTDLKATQTQLIQSEKMASLGELTAGIAHEIQNPLNFVNNFSDVSIELLDEMETELEKGDKKDVIAIAGNIRQNLEKINHHGKRAEGIVKGMLQHSKSSSGVKEPININALADEYMRLAYHGLRAKDKTFNAKMVNKMSSDLPKVNAVPQDIGRVMLNLFNNAFYAVHKKQKTAGPGYAPEVTLTTSVKNGKVEIKVRDNGIGIPDAIKDKIMQPFFTTKPTGEGTGLGLSLTYDMVVNGHGGSIDVGTREGQYTEFTINLPI